MLMKNIMREKGIVDEHTISITCPYCKSSGLTNSKTGEIITELYHDSDVCLFYKTCAHMKIDPYNLNDERVTNFTQMHFEIKKLF